ncbi:hypothetical protein ACU686_35405 [Yinghuangia aomiensis]
MDRRKWRLMGMMHIAETEEQARREVAYGLRDIQDYQAKVLPIPYDASATLDQRIDHGNASGSFICGTPEMAMAQIERLWQKSGGFGTYLFMGADFADPEATKRSYDLIAREVIPHFTGQSAGPLGSQDWQVGLSERWRDQTAQALGKAVKDYAADKAAASLGSGTDESVGATGGRVAGKVALVTGAGAGIEACGGAAAGRRRLVVVLGDIDEKALDAVLDELGPRPRRAGVAT